MSNERTHRLRRVNCVYSITVALIQRSSRSQVLWQWLTAALLLVFHTRQRQVCILDFFFEILASLVTELKTLLRLLGPWRHKQPEERSVFCARALHLSISCRN